MFVNRPKDRCRHCPARAVGGWRAGRGRSRTGHSAQCRWHGLCTWPGQVRANASDVDYARWDCGVIGRIDSTLGWAKPLSADDQTALSVEGRKTINSAITDQKRQELLDFIQRNLAAEPAIQAIIGIGSTIERSRQFVKQRREHEYLGEIKAIKAMWNRRNWTKRNRTSCP